MTKVMQVIIRIRRFVTTRMMRICNLPELVFPINKQSSRNKSSARNKKQNVKQIIIKFFS